MNKEDIVCPKCGCYRCMVEGFGDTIRCLDCDHKWGVDDELDRGPYQHPVDWDTREKEMDIAKPLKMRPTSPMRQCQRCGVPFHTTHSSSKEYCKTCEQVVVKDQMELITDKMDKMEETMKSIEARLDKLTAPPKTTKLGGHDVIQH